MADMFGAPLGIGAAERDQRDVVLGGLNAVKTMGEIEAQPVDLQMKRAHTRVYDATAAKMEQERATEEAFAALARGGAGQAGAGGPGLTQADQLSDLASKAINAGFVTKGTELAGKAAQIAARYASAGASNAAEQVRLVNAAKGRISMMGGIANAALEANTQAGYDQARMQAIEAGIDPSSLPEDFAAAKPTLKLLVDQSVKAIEKLKLKEDQLNGISKRGLQGVQAKVAQKRGELIDARTDIARRDYDEQVKNGGRFSLGALEARDTRTKLNQQKLEMNDRKEFPPAPVNPAAREIGKRYTAADGSKFLWTTDPATGKPVGQLLAVPKSTVPKAASAAGDDLEFDDDEED